MLNSINHTTPRSKRVHSGKYLEVFLTIEPESWFIDVLYKNSDVGLTFYETRTVSQRDDAIERAKAFVAGYDYARDEFVQWAKTPKF